MVEQIKPSVKLAFMDPDWMQNHLKDHPNAIKHRVVADGSIILAAETSELQKFLTAHMADKKFFGDAKELKSR